MKSGPYTLLKPPKLLSRSQGVMKSARTPTLSFPKSVVWGLEEGVRASFMTPSSPPAMEASIEPRSRKPLKLLRRSQLLGTSYQAP